MTFTDFNLENKTLDAIASMGYEEPTPIQAQCLPILLEGRDVVGQARTGSGKTAAFGIPMVDALRTENDDVRGLILVPTRELAIQVTEVLEDIAKGSRLAVISIYGGAGFGKQESALRRNGAKIVVATPGRLLDHAGRGTIDLGAVSFLVLDEADRMLDMGFVHDMRRVLELIPKQRQTALFSATLPNQVLKLVKEFTHDAQRVHVDSGEAVPDAEQFSARVEKSDKRDTLVHLLHQEYPERAVVFTRTKHVARRLAKQLDASGWSAVALQGNMTQNQRERAMANFRNGKARVLVATDVASRGLDVHGITHVVNYDLPDADAYVHRVGRTARNGAKGRAYTFVQSDEVQDFKLIQKVAGAQIGRFAIDGELASGEGPDQPTMPKQPQGGQGGGHRRQGGPKRGGGRPGGQKRHGGQGGGQGGPRRNSGGPRHGSGGRSGGGQGGRRSSGPKRGGSGGRSGGSSGPRRIGGGSSSRW